MSRYIHLPWRRTVVSAFTLGVAVTIASLGVVRAEHFLPNAMKTFKCSTGTACVTGNSTGSSTYGVYGVSTGTDGVHGLTDSSANSGVAGFATNSAGGHGVLGSSTAGDGVHGVTDTTAGNSGVYGQSSSGSGSGYGVYGSAANGPGTYGTSSQSGSAGVFGYVSTSVGGSAGVDGVGSGGNYGVKAEGDATSYNYPVLYAQANSSSTYIATFANAPNDVGCVIDPNADLYCNGTISGGGPLRIRERGRNGQSVVAYASESATPTIEDLGAARMHEGTANVELPSDFSSVISHNDAYYIFLTPLGDTRGLYVSMQTLTGFQVRENEHGRSDVMFEYRIVAVPSSARNVRLPAAPRFPTFGNGQRGHH
jgi:hypothetical protein